MAQTKVLVTGASGFIGSALTRKLFEEGYEVHVFCRPSSQFELLDGVIFTKHIGSLTNKDDIKKALNGCEYFFHLAGAIGYKKSQAKNMFQVNEEGTRACVMAANESPMLKRMIYMSSVVTIGSSWSAQKILNESSQYNLKKYNLAYFESKKEAEDLVFKAYLQNALPAIILNPSTVYGAGDMLKGSRKTQALVSKGKFPFYPPGGVSIAPLESVVEASLKAMTQGRLGERYILAGENITIKSLFKKIARMSQVPPPKIALPRWALNFLGFFCELLNLKAFDKSSVLPPQMFHYYSSQKAVDELNYKIGTADEAIQNSLQWFSKS